VIDRQGRKILIECDCCEEVHEGADGEEFAAVWSDAKRDGWRTKKVADEWLHGCPKHARSL